MTDWQPIETAPKDGTKVLVADCFGVECAEFIGPGTREEWWEIVRGPDEPFDEEGWAEHCAENDLGWVAFRHGEEEHLEPTHWMPFPEPPK